MKRFFKGFLIVLLISAVSITAYSLFENRKISLGSILPDDFNDVTALHIKKALVLPPSARLNKNSMILLKITNGLLSLPM